MTAIRLSSDTDILSGVVCNWIQAIVDNGHGEENIEDILDKISLGNYQLWAVVKPTNRFVAVAITEVVEYPRITVCRVVGLAGERMVDWAEELNLALMRFAKQQKCKRIESICRPGFGRKLKNLGLEVIYHVVKQEVR